MNARRKISDSLAAVFVAAGAVVLSVMTGCVAENLASCPPAVRLVFRYSHNTFRKDLFAENVRSVDVYVFDSGTGVLSDVIGASPSDIASRRRDVAYMPPGHYTMVAWGASGESMSRSYESRHMVDGARHDHTEVEIGTTTIDDLYMLLGSDQAPSGIDGDVVPVPPDFDDLFWAVAEGVEVVEGESRRVEFDFLRNTSTLRIAVTGLEHFAGPSDDPAATPGSTTADRLPLRLFATGENGRYRYDDTIDPHALTVHYASTGHRLTGSGMSLNIPMQRLHIRRHEDAPVLLHIEHFTGTSATSSRPIPGIPPIDLVSAITASTDGMGNYPYKTQEAIDREHEFRIALAISPDPANPGRYLLTMTINEWDVIIIEPVVDRPVQ